MYDHWSQFLKYELRLIILKTHTNCVIMDQFLLDFLAQTNVHMDRQTLNCHTATLLTIVSPWKQDLFNNNKN